MIIQEGLNKGTIYKYVRIKPQPKSATTLITKGIVKWGMKMVMEFGTKDSFGEDLKETVLFCGRTSPEAISQEWTQRNK